MTLAEHKAKYPHKNFEELLALIELAKPFKTISLSVTDCSQAESLTKLMVEVYDNNYRERFHYPIKALEATTVEESEANYEKLFPILQSFVSFLNNQGIRTIEVWDELVSFND